ncbi:MAG TPA: PEP-utilizing enzyme [Acidimicrobiales bacterium]|nr:PEP-utilizing enzyme [Acidimicrobiales bacterium]
MKLFPVLPKGRPQSALVASAVASGTRRQSFLAATGLDIGVHRHRFEGGAHAISSDDEEALKREISRRADTPDFWRDYVERASSAAAAAVAAARASLAIVDGPGLRQDVGARFVAVKEAMERVAPFVVSTPPVLEVLAARVAEQLARAMGPGSEHRVPQVVDRLTVPWPEPDPVGDMRGAYRIGLAILARPDAMELFVTTAPRITLERLGAEFPELHRLIQDHVAEYGWLRTQGTRFDPMTPLALVERVQLALVRWPADLVRSAAQATPVPDVDGVVGFAATDELRHDIVALQAMLSRRCFRVDVLLQAEAIARPFLATIAELLGCHVKQVLVASVAEIADALDERRPLDLSELDARARHGFTVRRDGEILAVDAADHSSAPQTGALSGMTACRGRAVGRVRIVLDQAELPALNVGDVLVTAASTIDPTDTTGAGTVFPTRNAGPEALALDRAAAVVADEGGLLSHGAIVCRERGLPSVLGAETATAALVDGQVVEIDGTKPVGVVISLDPPA